MNKRIPVWVLALAILLGVVLTVIFGWAVHHVEGGGKKLGKLGYLVLDVAQFPGLVSVAFSELKNKSPLLVHNRFPEIDGFKRNGILQSGATEDDGYLLESFYDNNRQQSVVRLISIGDQKILHEWVPNIQQLEQHQTRYSDPLVTSNIEQKSYRISHPLMLNDGALVFQNGLGGPLFKVDACSKLVWSNNQFFHHSIEKDSDGNIWVPTVVDPSTYNKNDFVGHRDDAIAKLAPNGKLLFKKSVSRILEENGYRGLVFGVGYYEANAIHLNEIQPALYSTKYWETGDLLLSIRHRSTVLLYRPSTNKVIWLRTGPWLNQHDADFVGQSKISVFGNNVIRLQRQDKLFDSHNNVYLYDLADGSISSPYSDVLKKLDVRTLTEGRQKILTNGDVIIEETDYARILRLSVAREVWQFTAKVDTSTTAMISWSRYLTKEQVKESLLAFRSATCSK